jgi:hypothetical protein
MQRSSFFLPGMFPVDHSMYMVSRNDPSLHNASFHGQSSTEEHLAGV